MSENRTNNRGRPFGGIGWIIKPEIEKYCKVNFISERITTLKINDLVIIGTYLTANDSSNTSFFEHQQNLSELICLTNELKKDFKQIVIIGDFNSDFNRKKSLIFSFKKNVKNII